MSSNNENKGVIGKQKKIRLSLLHCEKNKQVPNNQLRISHLNRKTKIIVCSFWSSATGNIKHIPIVDR